MREFKTSAKAIQPGLEGAEPITFKLDDQDVTAYPPTAGQMALLMASMSDTSSTNDTIATFVDFLDSILDQEGRMLFHSRLFDRDDPFDFDTIQEILEALIEEWTARPTSSSSASTPSPVSGGSRSTAKRRSGVSQA